MAEKLNKNSNQHWKNHNIPYNLRALCAQSIFSVIDQGKSLSTALSHYSHNINEKDKALMQEICFGALRVLPELEFYAQSLMEKVFTGKNRVIHHLILVGIYQILYTRVPEHAAASETVNGVVALKKGQLKPVINGVLRSFLRRKEELKLQFLQAGNTALHPNWLLKRIKQAYPDQWQEIIDANNQKPPMWLRVNRQHYSVEEYQKMLMDLNIESQKGSLDCAIRLLKPTAIHQLPKFENGVVTVQDLSAQKAVYLLDPQSDERILDMCAAPGGKTTHILEYAPNANVLAVDIDPLRVERIYENLNRLNLKAEVKVGDGLTPEKWCAGEQFDRILLDAPCSATGVIRRHPDIKWLRRDSDIAELVELQYRILNNIWSYLKPNGRLVYATCSILPDENRQQILRFLQEQPNAKLLGEMQQYIPEFEGGDGFFYAVLQKKSDY